jgi:hypothetical protein
MLMVAVLHVNAQPRLLFRGRVTKGANQVQEEEEKTHASGLNIC